MKNSNKNNNLKVAVVGNGMSFSNKLSSILNHKDLEIVVDEFPTSKINIQDEKEILDMFLIEKHKVLLVQIKENSSCKFGVEHSYDGIVGVLSYCNLCNKKEVATSLYNRICEDLKYKYKDLETSKEKEESNFEQNDIEMEL